jgi:hypothetical protein
VPETLGLVVVNDGAGLSVVGLETAGEGLGVVVGALDEGFAGDIVDTSLFGWAADTILDVKRRREWEKVETYWKVLWYERPLAGWIRRPVIREMRSWSSMRSCTTESSFSPRADNMPSSFWA